MTNSGTRDQPRSDTLSRAVQVRTDGILTALAEGVVIIDAAGVVLAVNESGERILGAPHGAMLGRVLLELPWTAFDEDGGTVNREAHPIIAALRSGQPQPERLLRYPRHDGASLWIATTARPLLDEDGRIEGALSSFRDVTAERTANELVKSSEARYRDLFERNATVQLIVNADSGVIEAANPAAIRFYGYAREALVGQHVSMLSRLDPSFAILMWQSTTTGQASSFRRTQYTAAGEARDVEIYASPISRGGRTLHAIVLDETSRTAAELGRRRLAAILDATPDVVGMFDLDGQLFYANQAGRAMMGLPPLPDGGVGAPMVDIPRDAIRQGHVEGDGDRVLREATEVAASEGVWRGETQLKGAADDVRTMRQTVIAHRNVDGSLSHFSTILHDVSDMRRAEMLLLDQSHELEVQTEELRQQSDELLAARDLAESANTAKSQFLAHMSHELRTPLTAIIGFSRVLEINKSGNLSTKERAYAERVLDNAVRLLGLIDQLLDLSKIEAGHEGLELSDVDVCAMTTSVIGDLSSVPRAAGVTLAAQLPPTPIVVSADATKLRQVLVNLVANAVKFTALGSVTVAVRPAHDDAPPTLSVIDTGVGVAPESQQIIFEPFSQEDTTITRRFGGTGLGLAISKRYCDAMGFSLTLSSVPGEGSTFTIHLTTAR